MIDNNQLVYIDKNITNSDSLKTTKLVKNFKDKTSNKVPHSDITLEKSIELYEEGAKLVAICYEKLESAELKFSQISLDKMGE